MKKFVLFFAILLLMLTLSACTATPADKTGLSALIEQCQIVKAEDYTSESYNNFSGKLVDAIAVRENGDATQTQVDNAKNALSSAFDALVLAPAASGNFTDIFSGILAKTVSTIAEKDRDEVESALAAFDKLSSGEKAQLANEKVLLESLLGKIEEIEAVNIFLKAYGGILTETTGTVTENDKAAVEAALTAFEKLVAGAQTQLKAEHDLLESLLSKIKELENTNSQDDLSAVLNDNNLDSLFDNVKVVLSMENYVNGGKYFSGTGIYEKDGDKYFLHSVVTNGISDEKPGGLYYEKKGNGYYTYEKINNVWVKKSANAFRLDDLLFWIRHFEADDFEKDGEYYVFKLARQETFLRLLTGDDRYLEYSLNYARMKIAGNQIVETEFSVTRTSGAEIYVEIQNNKYTGYGNVNVALPTVEETNADPDSLFGNAVKASALLNFICKMEYTMEDSDSSLRAHQIYEVEENKVFVHSFYRISDNYTETGSNVYFKFNEKQSYRYFKDENTGKWYAEENAGGPDSSSSLFSIYLDFDEKDFDYADGFYTMKASALANYLESYLKVNIHGGFDYISAESLKIKITDGFISHYEFQYSCHSKARVVTMTMNCVFSNYGNVTVTLPKVG